MYCLNGFSKMLKTAASLSITLVEEKCIHLAAWYEEDTEQIVTVKVKDEESCCPDGMGIDRYKAVRKYREKRFLYEGAF